MVDSKNPKKVMALKFKCKTKEEVPAELQSLYVEREGAFVLDVEGAVDNARVEEVRASNVALSHQLAEQKRRFEGIESEQVKAIAAKRDTLNARLTAIQVDQGVTTVATKKGLRPIALPDISRCPATDKLCRAIHSEDKNKIRRIQNDMKKSHSSWFRSLTSAE
jgi:hypothetical protein